MIEMFTDLMGHARGRLIKIHGYTMSKLVRVPRSWGWQW